MNRYHRKRRKFAFLAYCLTTNLIIVTALQWIFVLMFCEIGTVLTKYYWLGPLLLLIDLLLMCFFIFLEDLRFIFLLNWIIAIMIVECVTWGSARTIAEATSAEFGIAFGVSVILIIIFILTGGLLKYDLTLDVVVLFIIGIVVFIGTVFSTALLLITRLNYSLYIYCIFIISIILMGVMFHAQTINGGRYAETPIGETLLSSLIVYHAFIMCFLLIFIMLVKDTKLKYTEWDCNKTETEGRGGLGLLSSNREPKNKPILLYTFTQTTTVPTTTTTTVPTTTTTTVPTTTTTTTTTTVPTTTTTTVPTTTTTTTTTTIITTTTVKAGIWSQFLLNRISDEEKKTTPPKIAETATPGIWLSYLNKQVSELEKNSIGQKDVTTLKNDHLSTYLDDLMSDQEQTTVVPKTVTITTVKPGPWSKFLQDRMSDEEKTTAIPTITETAPQGRLSSYLNKQISEQQKHTEAPINAKNKKNDSKDFGFKYNNIKLH